MLVCVCMASFANALFLLPGNARVLCFRGRQGRNEGDKACVDLISLPLVEPRASPPGPLSVPSLSFSISGCCAQEGLQSNMAPIRAEAAAALAHAARAHPHLALGFVRLCLCDCVCLSVCVCVIQHLHIPIRMRNIWRRQSRQLAGALTDASSQVRNASSRACIRLLQVLPACARSRTCAVLRLTDSHRREVPGSGGFLQCSRDVVTCRGYV